MSLYSITYACGHDGERDIRGTNVHGEREREADRLARGDCPDCYREAQGQARHRVAATVVDLDALPALTGSDRQTAWATKIRIDGIAAIVTAVDQPPAGYGRSVTAVNVGHFAAQAGPDLTAVPAGRKPEVVALLTAAALRQVSASWWIDNRGRVPYAAMDVMTEPEHAELATILGHPS